jgi:aminoglycoside 3-N-acetyltransferase
MKLWYRSLRAVYAERVLHFTPDDLRITLESVGVRAGDTLLVHCSFGAFEGFTGNAMHVIRLLQDMVGPTGTIAMPNQPFGGASVDWAGMGKVFDVRKTPSAVGIVSEFFRRLPEVVRSIHPTHSVAVWGANAHQLISDHWKADTPCGYGTPYMRLLDVPGKVLHLGSTIHTTTSLHAVETVVAPVLPFSPLTTEFYDLTSIGSDGKIYPTHCRLFDRRYGRVRNPEKLVPRLKERGAYHTAKIANLEVLLIPMRELVEASLDLAAQGVYFYDIEKLETHSVSDGASHGRSGGNS